MRSRRLERATELVQRELSGIIAKNVIFDGAIITLTRTELSDDLHYGDVYFMVIPDKFAEQAHKILKKNIFDLQQALNKRLRMRPVPKIRFHRDEAEFEAAKLDELLKGV